MHTSHRSQFPNDLTDQITRDGRDPVASGGFADIYRGTLQVNNGGSIKIAIKAIKTYSGEDSNFSKKQKALYRSLPSYWLTALPVWLNLKHDNVLPLLGTTMGFGRFLAMVCPWVENGTLTSYLDDHHDSLSAIKILGLLNDVASGLQYLHSRFVVHGDLSGSNVLIHESGRGCIADFGLSMLLTELGASTFATSFHARGTLRWTAHELLDLEVLEDDMDEDSQRVAATTHSDVYSFGSIMLQILSGKVPYHYYKREAQVLHAISRGKLPIRPNSALVTEPRWTFIQRCWSAVDIRRPLGDELVKFTKEELDNHHPREIVASTLIEEVEELPRTQDPVEFTTTHPNLPRNKAPVYLPHRPVHSHYRPRGIVAPVDTVDPMRRTHIPVGSAATRPPPYGSQLNPARTRLVPEDLRRLSTSSDSSVPEIHVQPPSGPPSPVSSPSERSLLSPDTTNLPLPPPDVDTVDIPRATYASMLPGLAPYPLRHGMTSTSTGSTENRRREYSSDRNSNPGRPPNVSTSIGRVNGIHQAVPVLSVPHMSNHRYRDENRKRELEHGRDREKDFKSAGPRENLTPPPAPRQRPVPLPGMPPRQGELPCVIYRAI